MSAPRRETLAVISAKLARVQMGLETLVSGRRERFDARVGATNIGAHLERERACIVQLEALSDALEGVIAGVTEVVSPGKAHRVELAFACWSNRKPDPTSDAFFFLCCDFSIPQNDLVKRIRRGS